MKSAPSPYSLEGCCQQAFDISQEISNYEGPRLAVADVGCLRDQGQKNEKGTGRMKGGTSTKKENVLCFIYPVVSTAIHYFPKADHVKAVRKYVN